MSFEKLKKFKFLHLSWLVCRLFTINTLYAIDFIWSIVYYHWIGWIKFSLISRQLLLAFISSLFLYIYKRIRENFPLLFIAKKKSFILCVEVETFVVNVGYSRRGEEIRSIDKHYKRRRKMSLFSCEIYLVSRLSEKKS